MKNTARLRFSQRYSLPLLRQSPFSPSDKVNIFQEKEKAPSSNTRRRPHARAKSSQGEKRKLLPIINDALFEKDFGEHFINRLLPFAFQAS